MPSKSIRVNRTAASQYTLVTSKGETVKVNTAEESMTIDRGVEPHIALEVGQATGQDDYGDKVEYSDFSAFYAPSVGEQIASWYANKQ